MDPGSNRDVARDFTDCVEEDSSPLLSRGNPISSTTFNPPRIARHRLLHALCAFQGLCCRHAAGSHHFTAEERSKMNSFESIDYLPPSSAAYRKWLANQPHRRQWDRWLVMGLVGVSMGLLGHFLYVCINLLANIKYGVTRWIIAHANIGVAWLYNVTFTTALVAGSSALVVGWAPEAAGSGIPEVMAYLNGVLINKLFNVRTLLVKFASCALAVGAGLPVGPEGPLIHIGAAMGSAISQGHSTTMGFSTGFFRRFRNPKDKRDFVTAGASVGVATAFNAPIGGLLFAFEEVASFFGISLGWQVFFACMCATLALNLSKSAGAALTGQGHFGWFDSEVAFEAGYNFSSHVLAVVPAAIIGVTGGLFAILFTKLNLSIVRQRDKLLGGSPHRWRRMIEPCVLAILYTSGCMVLPLFVPCTPTECVVDQTGAMLCETGLSDVSTTAHSMPIWHDPDAPPSLPLYTCHVDKHGELDNPSQATWLPGSGSLTPGNYANINGTKTVYYNQLATLLFSTGEEGIKQLFARGTHRRFSYSSLATMGIFYFISAAIFSGSAISSGLFVPMLMVGAIIGRFMGLATVDIAQSAGKRWSPEVVGQWTWIDPGAFALVGAGAFMGGVTRLTVSLAVIMIEVSSDVHMLLPVLVATMTAKWIADAVTHSLYHSLLDLKCVPFLPPEPISKFSLDLIPVSYVMHSPVVALRQTMKVGEITAALRGVSHNGFPVVKDTPSGPVAIGLITRAHLTALLQRISNEGHCDGLEVEWTELNRKNMDPVLAARTVVEQQMVALQREMHGNSLALLSKGARGGGNAKDEGEPTSPHAELPEGKELQGAASGGAADAAFRGVEGVRGRSRGPGQATRPGWASQPTIALTEMASLQGDGAAHHTHSNNSQGLGTLADGGNGSSLFASSEVQMERAGSLLGASSWNAGDVSNCSISGSRGTTGLGLHSVGVGASRGVGGVSRGSTFGGGRGKIGPGGVKGVMGNGAGPPDTSEVVVDLMPYVNTSSFVILDTFSVERTYIMIRTMGLRHLVVVDEHNHVRGIVTRKDMMGDKLDEALERALGGVVSNNGNWTSGNCSYPSPPCSRALIPPTLPVTVVSGPGVGAAWSSSSTQDVHHHLRSIDRPPTAATLDSGWE